MKTSWLILGLLLCTASAMSCPPQPATSNTERTLSVRFGGHLHIGSLCSPFAVQLPTGIKAYKITGTSSDGILLAPYITDDGTLPAATPFILQSDAATEVTLTEAVGSIALPYDIPTEIGWTFEPKDNTNADVLRSDTLIYALGYASGHAGEHDFFGFYPYIGQQLPTHRVFIRKPQTFTPVFEKITDITMLEDSTEVVLVAQFDNSNKYYHSTDFASTEIAAQAVLTDFDEQTKTFVFIRNNDQSNAFHIKIGSKYLVGEKNSTNLKLTTEKISWSISKEADTNRFSLRCGNITNRRLALMDKLNNSGSAHSHMFRNYTDKYTANIPELYKKKRLATNSLSKPLKLDFAPLLGIENTVSESDRSHTYYNIRGERVTTPQQRGIYIIGKKKIKY